MYMPEFAQSNSSHPNARRVMRAGNKDSAPPAADEKLNSHFPETPHSFLRQQSQLGVKPIYKDYDVGRRDPTCIFKYEFKLLYVAAPRLPPPSNYNGWRSLQKLRQHAFRVQGVCEQTEVTCDYLHCTHISIPLHFVRRKCFAIFSAEYALLQ